MTDARTTLVNYFFHTPIALTPKKRSAQNFGINPIFEHYPEFRDSFR